ncbi:hypothetical protein MP638_005870, partial [Amoeboaphelidium occidentale]
MKFQLSSIILCLCAAIQVTSADNDFKKYLSAKKSSIDYLHSSIVGVYKNWHISYWEGDIQFIDVDTGALVKTITASFTLTDGNSLLSGAEVVDKCLMLYYSDSVIQQWDLETGTIEREIKPSRSSTLSRECVWHFDLDLVFCSLSTGFVRKINMATKKIETEFDAHDFYCSVQVNSSFVYTASIDGLVKKFDLFGNLLNTYELSLGYAYIGPVEGEYFFVRYYNIEFDRKIRIVRWNHITGIPEEFPVPMSTILDPRSASRDYYFAVSVGPLSLGYVQFFKSNLSVVRADLNGYDSYWTFYQWASDGKRFFIASNNTVVELLLSDEGLTLGERIHLKYSNPTISNFVVLNESTIIAVFSTQSNLQYNSRFIDLSSGIISKDVDTFTGHSRFLVSGDFLYAAVGTKVVAYHMANLSLAWASPDMSPQNIGYFQIKDGLIYLSSQNYVGWYNTSTFDRIGSIILGDVSYGTFDILNGVLYAFYTSNSVYALDLTDGRILRRYIGMSNIITRVLIYGDYVYISSYDSFLYKFDFESESPLLIFAGHTREVLAILIRGRFMYSGSRDQTIRKWNIDTGEPLFIYYGHNEGINELHIYNQKLFSATDKEVRIWDLNRDRLFKTLSDRSTNVISLRNSGNNLLTCTMDGTISLWNTEKGYKVNDLVQGEDGTSVIGTQWQNNSLFIARNNGNIFRFNPGNDSVAILVSGSIVEMPTALFMKNDVVFLFGAAEGLVIKNLTSDIVRRIEIKNYVSNSLLVTDQFIFSGNNDTSITKYDASSLDLLRTIIAHTGSVTVLGQFENQLISGSEDNSLRTWNIDNLNLVLDLKRDSTRLGHLAAEGLAIKNLTSDIVRRIEIKNYVSNSLLVTDQFIFSGNNDTSITKFDASSLGLLRTIKAHTGSVAVLGQFENQLISGSEDNSLRTWDLDNLNLVFDLKRDSTRLGHLGPITVIHVEGENLFSGSEDKNVKRWNLNTGKVLFTYLGHIKKVTAISYNNGSLFTTAEDEIIQIFSVNIVPSRSTSSATSSTLTRIPPRIINNVEESSGLSTTFLIIIISAAVVLLISFAVTYKWFTSKKTKEKSENDAAFYSGQNTVNMTTGFDMTLAPTNI